MSKDEGKGDSEESRNESEPAVADEAPSSKTTQTADDSQGKSANLLKAILVVCLLSLGTSAYSAVKVSYLQQRVSKMRSAGERRALAQAQGREGYVAPGTSAGAQAVSPPSPKQSRRNERYEKVLAVFQGTAKQKAVVEVLTKEGDQLTRLRAAVQGGSMTMDQARQRRLALTQSTVQAIEKLASPEELQKFNALRSAWGKAAPSSSRPVTAPAAEPAPQAAPASPQAAPSPASAPQAAPALAPPATPAAQP